MAREHLERYRELLPQVREALNDRSRFAKAGRGLLPAWFEARRQAERGLASWAEQADMLRELLDARREAAGFWPDPKRFKQPEGDSAKLAQALDKIAALTAAAMAAGWL